MNEKQDWKITGAPQKLSKRPIGFFSSYESREEISKKSKPSKIAQLNFIKKIRNMRKKLKYLTEAQESEDEFILLSRRYYSSGDSQTPSSQQYLKRPALYNSNQGQIFRKLLKVEEDNNQNQDNQIQQNQDGNEDIKSVARYFQHKKQDLEDDYREYNS